jgi:hypothetical protein
MAEIKRETKRSFWQFGGKLDPIFNCLVGLFFVWTYFVQIMHHKARPSEVLGIALGQTFCAAIVLFVHFKGISLSLRKG